MATEMKKILVISDSVAASKENGGLLNRSSFRIFNANTAAAGLEQHRSERMDMIISDLALPDMRGDELCRKIRADDGLKRTSILLICNNRTEDIETCKNCGANNYIVRPFNAEQFNQKVTSLLDVSHRHHYRILLRVSLKKTINSETYFCSSTDISKSGMSFESELKLEKGDMVVCSFFLASGHRIVTDGEVVRITKKEKDQYLYGVKFVNINNEMSESIEAFVKKHE